MKLWELLPAVVWVLIILWFFKRYHIVALRRYRLQMLILEREYPEETDMHIVARNQHFRYAVRCTEAVLGILIGVLGGVGVYVSAIAKSPIYFGLTLGFFYATQILTGWLSARDLHVLDRIGVPKREIIND